MWALLYSKKHKQTEPDEEITLCNLSYSTNKELLQGKIITILLLFC